MFERMFDYLRVSTAALQSLRTRLDQQRSINARSLSVHEALAEVLPGGGLRRGSTVTLEGSLSLALALIAGGAAGGHWAAVVGVPEIGVRAAVELGADLDRLVLIPRPGNAWATTVAALTDAIDVIVVRPPGRVSGQDAHRLAARARQRGAVLVCLGDWEGADLRLAATGQRWVGLGNGYGRLRARSMTVRVHGRGAAAVSREKRIWLPGGDEELTRDTATIIEWPRQVV